MSFRDDQRRNRNKCLVQKALGPFANSKEYIQERAIEVAQYIADSGDTVRGAAEEFGISKSTVHKDVTQRLPKGSLLAKKVRDILYKNNTTKHIRGGEATRKKYKRKK